METSSRFLLSNLFSAGHFLIGQLYARWYGIGVPIRFPTKEDIDYTVIGMLLTLGFAAVVRSQLSRQLNSSQTLRRKNQLCKDR